MKEEFLHHWNEEPEFSPKKSMDEEDDEFYDEDDDDYDMDEDFVEDDENSEDDDGDEDMDEEEEEEEEGDEDFEPDLDIDPSSVDTEKFLAGLAGVEEDVLLEKRHFQCPKCKKFYQNGKWVQDSTISLTVLKPELAFCDKCQKKIFEDEWIGRVVIHDRNLDQRKEMFIAIAEQIARTRENLYAFEGILAIYEENGLLYINTNTTSLAKAIGQRLREDYHGAIEYHWQEKNQYLTVDWYDELKNSDLLKEKIKQKKERYPGIYFFEDED